MRNDSQRHQILVRLLIFTTLTRVTVVLADVGKNLCNGEMTFKPLCLDSPVFILSFS